MEQNKCVQIKMNDGSYMQVTAVGERVLRVRRSKSERFEKPALLRYGIMKESEEPVSAKVCRGEGDITLSTAYMSLTVSSKNGGMVLRNAEGAVLTENDDSSFTWNGSGFEWSVKLYEDERLYGLGDVTRETVQKRGGRYKIWNSIVTSYVTIPYLMSTRKWGVLSATTWRHYFDIGKADPDRMYIQSDGGEPDLYLFAGDGFAQLLDVYTSVAGRPVLLPLWAYGLVYVCNQQENARELIDDCLSFRREGIPCDVIGLEPGWMEKRYDYSVDKRWDPVRFCLPHWAAKGEATFIGAVRRLGFKLSLWLCCDYDLSFEEERRAGEKVEGGLSKSNVLLNSDNVEMDENGTEIVYADKITKRNEPWFRHLEKFVDQGVSAFKLDASLQVNEHPDKLWGNGMTDAEMHNLYPVLLNKQMQTGFREQTGHRPMVYSAGGYIGIQQYSATWAGDTGGGAKTIISMLNHGMSGHVNTSCDMEIFSREGIHYGFLQPWSQLCSWAYWKQPWLLGDKLKPVFQSYARLRYRLIPYIYSMAHVAAATGFPLLRAMSLLHPENPACDGMVNQYMLGDSLLVTAFSNQVWLPEGKWIDAWTGRKYSGGGNYTIDYPDDKGGLLFIQEGAIIPNWPDMEYIGQKSTDTLFVHVYPGDGSFTLYEDDGETFDYINGKISTTQFTSKTESGTVTIRIAPREGAYDGMPAQRTYKVCVHTDKAPKFVNINGETCPWKYEEGMVCLTSCEIGSSVEITVG